MKVLRYSILDLLKRAVLLAILWWVISGGASDSWLVGLPVVLIAAYLSLLLKAEQAQRIHLIPLLRFIPFFLYASVCGGVDVARRICLPRLLISPAFLSYPLRLPEGSARVLFANSISLLPGTFCMNIEEHELQLHVLDKQAPIIKELEILEFKVATIFGINLNEEKRNETL